MTCRSTTWPVFVVTVAMVGDFLVRTWALKVGGEVEKRLEGNFTKEK